MSSEQTSKFIHNFKKGDIVHFHGARFECLEDALMNQADTAPWPDILSKPMARANAPYAALSALMVRKRAATSNTVANGPSRATS